MRPRALWGASRWAVAEVVAGETMAASPFLHRGDVCRESGSGLDGRCLGVSGFSRGGGGGGCKEFTEGEGCWGWAVATEVLETFGGFCERGVVAGGYPPEYCVGVGGFGEPLSAALQDL